jgi:hypothetical protein
MIGSNSKSEGNFKDSLAKISGVLGFCVALVSFVLNLQKWVQDPQTFRATSIAGFILYLLGSLWFAFIAKNVNPSWRWLSLVVLYISSGLYFIWVGTWLVVPAPAPVIIDTMDGVSLWNTYLDDKGSSITVGLAPGRTTNAMELSYTVKKDGYAAVSREISSEILASTKAIGFSFKGSGAPNTIELKLLYKPNDNGKSAIFGVLWNRATDVKNWTSVVAPYSLFVCWTATGCEPGEALDPSKVWKIDIAISSKAGDTPGSGTILVDDVQGIR